MGTGPHVSEHERTSLAFRHSDRSGSLCQDQQGVRKNRTEKPDTPGGYPTSRVRMFFDDAADGRLWRWLGEAERLSEGGECFACSGKRGADYFQMRQTFSADERLHRSKECRLFPKRADFFFFSEILFPPRSDEADHSTPFRTI